MRDYQEEGVIKALVNGNGIELVPTAAGKTLMMASIIQNVTKRNPSNKVLLITLTHLIEQTYQEFISYGINPLDISKWSGENPLNTNSKIVICGTTILYSKIDNTALELKKAKVAYLGILRILKKDFTLTDEKRKEHEILAEAIKKDIEKIQKRDDANKIIHDYLETIDLLLIDECHTLKQENEINNVLKYIKTRNRFAFTGTMPESLIDQWNIIGKTGPIIHTVSRDMLVEQKYIADTDVKILLLDYKDRPEVPDKYASEDVEEDEESNGLEHLTSRYQAELDFLQKHPFRNGIIKKIIEKLDKNALIVLDRIPHGEHLLTYLTQNLPNKRVFFIKGEVENEDRDKIKQLMEIENNVVCIAISKIFSTGINIKNLHYIFFAAAGKAKIKTVQTIGRGVRMLAGKVKVTIFDLADNLHYGKQHLEKRIQIYDNEHMRHNTIQFKEG
jgi:superfamily II DNA or RNA helicase